MSSAHPDPSTPLQRRLAREIAMQVQADGLPPGALLNQKALAAQLGVSRTPVRAAIGILSRAGLVRLTERGAEVFDPSAGPQPEVEAVTTAEALLARVARDRHQGLLEADVTEADLMRRYGATRADVVAALKRLADLGIVMRKPGFGWRFLAATETADEKRAAYRFRLAVEPAALLEPGYHADADWVARMRDEHARYLDATWRDGDAVAFFEMNAAFHLGLVSFSGNRFFIQATEQQNSLRRLRNYSWRLGEARVRVSCSEHLSILDALSAGDPVEAARRLSHHLSTTAHLVTQTTEPHTEGAQT